MRAQDGEGEDVLVCSEEAEEALEDALGLEGDKYIWRENVTGNSLLDPAGSSAQTGLGM